MKERLKIESQVAIGSLLLVLRGQNVRFYTRKATTTRKTRFIVSTPEVQKKLYESSRAEIFTSERNGQFDRKK